MELQYMAFMCPKCGGQYFGTSFDIDGKFHSVDCHNDINGGPTSMWEYNQAGDLVMRAKNDRPAAACGWRGFNEDDGFVPGIVRVVRASMVSKHDDGTTKVINEPELWIQIGDRFYRLKSIQSAVGARADQLIIQPPATYKKPNQGT